MIPFKVVKKNKQSILIEYITDGVKHRCILPVDIVRGSSGSLPIHELQMGVEIVPANWSDIVSRIDDVLSRELMNRGVWTVEDALRDYNTVRDVLSNTFRSVLIAESSNTPDSQ